MKRKRLFVAILALLMLFSLTACGKGDGETKNSNVLKVGDYELLYKSACIMEDYAGNDAIVLTLDFKNNSKKSAAYIGSIVEFPVQNKKDLEFAVVYVSEESDEMVSDSQMMDVAPGETIEIKTAFVLVDTTSEVEIVFEELYGDKNASLTIDPSTLRRESGQSSSTPSVGGSTPSLTGGSKAEGTGGKAGISGSDTDVFSDWQPRDWWNGEWYGWWMMTGCWGYYEDMDGEWWDVCATIDIGEDGMGTVILWDEDYTKADPMASASVSLSEAGTSQFGTMMSEGGWFTDIALEHADWIVDPGLVDYPNLLHISGYYENGDDEFTYDIYLRPWGTYWDDMVEEDLPYYYYDWYLPLIETYTSMPDSIG